jgi:hypothetical protein
VDTKEIIYFDEPGPQNTDDILKLAKSRIESLGIRTVVIASQAGVTVKRFMAVTRDMEINIITVTNPRGPGLNITVLYDKYENSKRIKEDYEQRGVTHFQCSISDEDRIEFEKLGVPVLAIAGTGFAGGGADTAAILRAGSKARGCLVKEILGFPRLK